MAPHLSLAELDLIAKAAGEQKAPKDIHALISVDGRGSGAATANTQIAY